VVESEVVGGGGQVHYGFERGAVRGGEAESAATTCQRWRVSVIVEVNHAALGADGQEIGGCGEGGGDGAVLVVEAFDTPSAADVPPVICWCSGINKTAWRKGMIIALQNNWH